MTMEVRDSSSEEVFHLAPEVLVNAAGLQAQEVAGKLKGLAAQHVPKRHLARGCYFSLSGTTTMLPAVTCWALPYCRALLHAPVPLHCAAHRFQVRAWWHSCQALGLSSVRCPHAMQQLRHAKHACERYWVGDDHLYHRQATKIQRAPCA